MEPARDPSATQITIGLYLLSAFAVLCMGWMPGAEQEGLHHYAYAGAPVLLGCAVVSWSGERVGSLPLIQGSLVVSNLLITVTVAVMTSRVGDAYEVEIFYLLPLLLAAHFHGSRFVALSIVISVIGHPIGLIIGYGSRDVSGTDLVSEALARAIPVGAVMASVTILVHRMRLRDRSQQLLLHDQATTDALTGVLNRRGLRHAIDNGRAAAGDCAVVMVDLDRFKTINDSEGHDVGDRVLRTTADALIGSAGDRAEIARFGGEEFVVLLPGRSIDDATRCCRTVATALRSSTASITPVTASYGITDWGSTEPFADAIKRADEAVYDAKTAGRDRMTVRRSTQSTGRTPAPPAG